MLGQAPGRTCGPREREAHTGAGLLAGLVTPWGTHAGAVHGGLSPMGRTHAGAGEGCEEEGAAEPTCDELTTTPIPQPTAPLGGRSKRNRE